MSKSRLITLAWIFGAAIVLEGAPLDVRAAEPHAADAYPFELDSDHSVGRPVAQGPLAVFPLYRKVRSAAAEYLTLDEATKQKTIRIREKDGGSVPVVTISNKGKLPIYVAAGEVILGGKQDRMISADVLIKPGATMTVDVRCVEQGRWHGSSKEFKSAGAMGGNRTKMAVQFRGQGEVWREVAEQNADNHAQSSSGSYRASLTDAGIGKRLQRYAEVLLPGIEGRNAVGMIVAINGKVHAIEIFGSPGLFAKMRRKLLDSYAMESLTVEDLGKRPPRNAEIVAFYHSVLLARAEEARRYKHNMNMKRENADGALNDSTDEEGELIHRSLLAH